MTAQAVGREHPVTAFGSSVTADQLESLLDQSAPTYLDALRANHSVTAAAVEPAESRSVASGMPSRFTAWDGVASRFTAWDGPKISRVISGWDDETGPTCPFECLRLQHHGSGASQLGNCGCDCTTGIEPAKNGEMFPE